MKTKTKTKEYTKVPIDANYKLNDKDKQDSRTLFKLVIILIYFSNYKIIT